MSDTVLTVTKVVPVPADQLFAALADPAQHATIDGSGTVRGAVAPAPISQVGDVFTIDMHQEAFGDYQIANHVVEYEPARRIAWSPGMVGTPPIGHLWIWALEGNGDSTTVTHSCDWSAVTDEKMLAMLSFPRVSAQQMEASIDNLASSAG